MNEDIQKQLIEYLKQAVDLGKTEMPKVCGDLLIQGQITAWCWIIGGAIGILIGVTLGFFCWKDRKCGAEEFAPFIVISSGLFITGMVIEIINFIQLISISMAPRAYLLYLLKDLIK